MGNFISNLLSCLHVKDFLSEIAVKNWLDSNADKFATCKRAIKVGGICYRDKNQSYSLKV